MTNPDKDPKKEEEEEKKPVEELAAIPLDHTGEGYVEYGQLVDLITAWQKRKHWEDVDLFENKGGYDWLLSKLRTDPKKGIDSSSIPSREKAFSSNAIKKADLQGFWSLLWDALQDLTLIILTIAAVASIIINTIMEVDHRSTGMT